jgi:hypothetical protein
VNEAMFHVYLRILLLLHCAICLCEAEEVPQNYCKPCVAGVQNIRSSDTTPTLYHNAPKSGPGGNIYSIFHAVSFAANRGWIYGGTNEPFPDQKLLRFYGINFGSRNNSMNFPAKIETKVMRASELATIKGPPWKTSVFSYETDDWSVLEKNCSTEPFPRFRYHDQVHVLDSIFQPPFLNAIRESSMAAIAAYPLRFQKTESKANISSKKGVKKPTPTVALHIRRGAFTRGTHHTKKYLLDAYYYSIIEIIRDRYPAAEVHGFPMLGKRERDRAVGNSFNVTDFAGYVKRNVTLHFDLTTEHTWAHMIQADFFVMAHSVYSSLPALLNQNCVVYDHFWIGKLARYATIHTLKDKFSECYKPRMT